MPNFTQRKGKIKLIPSTPKYEHPLDVLTMIQRMILGSATENLAMDNEAMISLGEWLQEHITRLRKAYPRTLTSIEFETLRNTLKEAGYGGMTTENLIAVLQIGNAVVEMQRNLAA